MMCECVTKGKNKKKVAARGGFDDSPRQQNMVALDLCFRHDSK